MFFWKRGKKEEFSDEQIEKIIDEYMLLMKEAIGRYLPRRMRRALNKNKGWKSLSASKKREQLQDIRQKGLKKNGKNTGKEKKLLPLFLIKVKNIIYWKCFPIPREASI